MSHGPAPAAIPSSREALRYYARLLRLIRPYWRGIATGFLLGLVLGLVGLVMPYLSKLFIDEVYPTRNVGLLQVLVVGVFVVGAASTLMGTLSGFYSAVVSARLGGAITLLFFNHLQHLPARFYDEHQVGEVLSRSADMHGAIGSLTGMLQTVVSSVVYLTIVPPFLFLLNWRLAVLSLITVPFTTAISTASGRVARRYWKQSAEASAALGALQFEVLSHIRTLKTLVVEHHVYNTAATRMHESMRTQLRASGVGMLVGVGTSALSMAGNGLFSWYAWTLILRGAMTLGDFVVFSAYLGYLTAPIGQIAGLVSQFQHASVSLGRAFEYLDAPVEQDPAAAYTVRPSARRAHGELAVVDVAFGYTADREVLRDVSLVLRPGTVTALVGPSGAGKSSLLRVLCRLAEPTRGVVLLDGVPASAISLTDFRRQISVVSQDVALLQGTLWENITYGLDPSAPGLAARVHEAVRSCQLESLVRELPDGLDTRVAEWGATLSGGQRQRIALAQALVRDTPVLLLDEATSQVDVLTEESLLQTILAAAEHRAVLFVTHRIASAALADQICVLDGGTVVGVGPARELAADCEPYRRLLRAAGLPVSDAAATATRPETRPLRVLGGGLA